MNYTVDFLLKCVSEESTFCLFLHLLRNHHLSCLYETQVRVVLMLVDVLLTKLISIIFDTIAAADIVTVHGHL